MDFLSFSGHKMLGPTGIGVLIGKHELLEETDPLCYGGGMNQFFEEDNSYELKEVPIKFEAGTPPIAEVIGLREAIKYLDSNTDTIKKLKGIIIPNALQLVALLVFINGISVSELQC